MPRALFVITMSVPRRSFDELLQRLAALEAATASERSSAQAELARLLELPPEERPGALAVPSLALAELLLEESRRQFTRDPDLVWHHATLASEVCDRLLDAESAPDRPRTLIVDAALTAHAHQANVLRIRGDLEGADALFATVIAELVHGSGEPGLVAEIFLLLASLRREQHRLPEALACATRAAGLYRELGETDQLALCLISAAIVQYRLFRPAEALASLDEAEAAGTADGSELPDHLYRTIQHNRALIHLEDGAFEDARRALTPRLLSLYESMGERGILLGSWLQGQMLANAPSSDPGEHARLRAEALEILWAVRDAKIRSGETYDLVLVSLDLATVYAELGESEAVLSVLDDLEPFLAAPELHAEVLATLVLVRDALRQDVLTAEVARQWRVHLDRVRVG